MTQRVLLTGSSGALGRVMYRRFVSRPHEFTVFAPTLDNQNDGLDLRNASEIPRAIKRICPDLIMHLAATFSSDFDEAYSINVAATQKILAYVESSGSPIRVVLVGSAAEYGVVTEDENPIKEEHALHPVSIYGLTKSWQTELAGVYASRGVDVVVARIFNLVGPGLSERLFVGRVHQQIQELLRGERQKIEVGSLSAIRDYISLDDAVIQLHGISALGKPGHVYHVASGQPVVMRELLARELEAVGLKASIVVEDIGMTNRSGYDVPAIYADMSRTRALLKNWNSDANN